MMQRYRLGIFCVFLIASGVGAIAYSSHSSNSPVNHHPSTENVPATPTLAGQDAFAAIQEIVAMLEADPTTNWEQVNLAALREHLIDMNEVTLKAVVEEQTLSNGVEISVTGTGRTREAIQRMLPAHTEELRYLGWEAIAEPLATGVKLMVMSGDAHEVEHIQALGFAGLLTTGSHHQLHHLAIARGEVIHHVD
jgi:hypothetical protein